MKVQKRWPVGAVMTAAESKELIVEDADLRPVTARGLLERDYVIVSMLGSSPLRIFKGEPIADYRRRLRSAGLEEALCAKLRESSPRPWSSTPVVVVAPFEAAGEALLETMQEVAVEFGAAFWKTYDEPDEKPEPERHVPRVSPSFKLRSLQGTKREQKLTLSACRDWLVDNDMVEPVYDPLETAEVSEHEEHRHVGLGSWCISCRDDTKTSFGRAPFDDFERAEMRGEELDRIAAAQHRELVQIGVLSA